MTSATPKTSGLPVVRSSLTRGFFFSAAIISVGILEWIHQLRDTSALHGLTPIFLVLYIFNDYGAAMSVLIILIGAVFVPSRLSFRPALRWAGEHPGTLTLASGILMGAGSLFIYRNHPLSMDEYAPYLQSQAFAAGHLTGKWPPQLLNWLLPESFQNYFLDVSHSSGRVISAYWPSFALLLTPFTFLGIPWACNPLLTALTLLVLHRLALRIFDDIETAGLVLVLTVASPEFFANGITYYSMPAHMLANGCFALLLLKASTRRAILAGFVGSIALTLHNPVPHMLFAIPWLAWFATRRGGARTIGWLALGYAPLCLLLGVGWFWFSGRIMHENQATVATIANGAGNVLSAFGLPDASVWLARLIALAKIWLWSVPGLLLLAAAGAWRWRHDTRIRLLFASAALTFVGYMFVPLDQGHGWGFRYFHSAWLTLPLLGAAALKRAPAETVDARPDDPHAGLLTYVVACALLSLTVGVGLRAVQMNEFMARHLSQQPGLGLRGQRVELLDIRSTFYGQDLVQNDALLRGDIIRMLGRTPAENAAMMRKQFPGYRRVRANVYGEVWTPGP